ncbi:IclR family transcriptional regulator C-terminal domain-containing protein [Dactylosporangium sp. NPDC050688]|uniref:IclR family transcriptional regulator n=1 Tax=Dactylosporangium sp. NPDC050688 TaxID=3157217 RepID=UPI0033F70881
MAGAESGRRLLSVLLSFSERRPLWTVTELSAELGMGTSMIYRYVALLREVGLVDKAENNQYRLTDLAAALAGAATAGRTPIGAVAMPVITRIRDTVDETVLVARRSGWRVYTVDRVESRRPVRLQFEPGRAMDLHTGALSRVLLAAMPAEDRLSFLAQLSAEERARSSLEAGELDRVLADGYAESFEEIDEGIWGVAAPVLADGTVHGALGVAAPLFRTDEARRRSIRELVLAGAGEVSALLQRGTPG